MPKDIKRNSDCFNSILDGVNELADSVCVTLGPAGKNAVIEREFSGPLITNDGVTIARAIELKDKHKNLGAQILKEAAIKTNDNAGDGTTTSIVLAREMLKIADELDYKNVVEFRNGMNYAKDIFCNKLNEISIPVNNISDIYNVAKISSGNEYIADLIKNAIDAIGKDGIITVEESSSLATTIETKMGMNIDSGYMSSVMITDEDKLEAVLESPLVYITNKTLSTIGDISEPLEVAIKESRPIFIIAKNIEGDASNTLVANILRGTLKAVAVKTPFGDTNNEILYDIASLCKCKPLLNNDIDKFNREIHIGSTDRIITKKDYTTIVSNNNNSIEVLNRAKLIKDEILNAKSDFDKKNLEKRLAKLVGGVAVIKVGAPTEIEMKEMKLRIEDSINATKSAIEEGIVPGGGAALMYLNNTFNMTDELGKHSIDFNLGIHTVFEALTAPARTIQFNYNPNIEFKSSICIEKNMALDIQGKLVDMFESGIIDPVKVTKNALINSVSVASTLLTTNVSIVYDNDKKENKNIMF